jgi:hemerythrin
MSFLNQDIPKFEPSYKTNKHHEFIHACIDYLGDARVRKTDLEAVIRSRLPVDDRKWFQQWWQEGKYEEFERAFREKYGTTIAFGEFNKYLNEFKFNDDMGAIKNARRLRDHTRSVIALLAKDSDKEHAEWALLEFFKDWLDPHDARCDRRGAQGRGGQDTGQIHGVYPSTRKEIRHDGLDPEGREYESDHGVQTRRGGRVRCLRATGQKEAQEKH